MTTHKGKITKRVVDTWKYNPDDPVLWDAELKGFGVKSNADGTRSYLTNYRASHRAVPHRPSHHPPGAVSHGKFPAPSLRSTTAPPAPRSPLPRPNPGCLHSQNSALPCLSVLGGHLDFLSLRVRRRPIAGASVARTRSRCLC